MTAPATKYLSLSEYFEFEYKAKVRHEYLDGKLRPMSYTSSNHGDIVHNINRLIGNYMSDKVGKVYTETRMLYVPECSKVYYPDVLVILGEHQKYFHKGKMEATLNPTALIEIASDSTEEHDKNEKWECYQTIESLQQYVLISQKSVFIGLYERQTSDSEKWIYTGHRDLETIINISGCNISLKDIYNKVEFPVKAEQENEEISE